ncbi:MAG: redoxin domain-containing protein [Patescibacteria group bacterium]
MTHQKLTAILAGVLALGGLAWYFYMPATSVSMAEKSDDVMEVKGDVMLKDGEERETDENVMMKNEGKMEIKDTSTKKTYTGKVLAGTTAPLLDFNKADYNLATEEGRLIVLFFYATWCPYCQAELPEAQAAFNALTDDRIVGFRVNYNDPDTDSDEQALAREFGVGYQHTKVLLRGGNRLGKSPTSWDKNNYLEAIKEALQ